MKTSDMYEYLFLGVDALVVGVLYSWYRRRDEALKKIMKAPVGTVGPELANFVERQGGNIPFMVLRGKVQPKEGTIKSSSGLDGVLQVISLNEHSVRRHAFGHWGDSVRTLNQTANAVPFYMASLHPDSSNSVLVEIHNPFSADCENLLMPVSTNFSPAPSSVASTVMGFFTGQASKGFETTEDLLPVGAIITGIGQVSMSNQRNVILSEPTSRGLPFILSTLPVEAIIKRKEADNFLLKLTAYFLATAGVILIVRRLNIWWKIRKEQKMRENILRVRENRELDNLHENETCVVCLRNPRELLLMDCGHVAVCADCCPRLDGKCPICRNRISRTHPAYLA